MTFEQEIARRLAAPRVALHQRRDIRRIAEDRQARGALLGEGDASDDRRDVAIHRIEAFDDDQPGSLRTGRDQQASG